MEDESRWYRGWLEARRLAAHQGNACRLNATIALYDESGFTLRPLVRRSWALRGQTPVLRCWDRRGRLSVIGGILVPRSRQRHRLSAVFRIHARSIKTLEATEFLRVLDRHVRRPMIVVQNKLNAHGAAVGRRPDNRPEDASRVMVERLPSYAPELNPAEQLRNNGKRVDLANLAPADRDDLRGHVGRSLIGQRGSPNPLASALDHARLPLRPIASITAQRSIGPLPPAHLIVGTQAASTSRAAARSTLLTISVTVWM